MRPTPDPARLDALPARAESLSPAGRARRDAMLAPLESAVRWRGHRRVAALGLATLSPALAIAALLTVRPFSPPAPLASQDPAVADPGAPATPTPTPTQTPTQTPPAIGHGAASLAHAPTAPVHRLVGYVTNDPGASARYAVTGEPLRFEVLDDDALLDSLRSAGLPAGIVRTHERIALAFHPGGAEHATQ